MRRECAGIIGHGGVFPEGAAAEDNRGVINEQYGQSGFHRYDYERGGEIKRQISLVEQFGSRG